MSWEYPGRAHVNTRVPTKGTLKSPEKRSEKRGLMQLALKMEEGGHKPKTAGNLFFFFFPGKGKEKQILS